VRILIGCEESQTVTKAFRKLGHEAFSCDIFFLILPCVLVPWCRFCNISWDFSGFCDFGNIFYDQVKNTEERVYVKPRNYTGQLFVS
jgi:hypothetical protein